VAGFAILGAKRFGVAQVRIDIDARKENIERGIRSVPNVLVSGRPTKVLIESVAVTAHSRGEVVPARPARIADAFKEAISVFKERYLESKTPQADPASP
jgi:hypothetical protein